MCRKFLEHNEESLRELTAEHAKDRKVSMNAARQRIEDLEQLLCSDLEDEGLSRDIGWDAESLREDYGESPE